VAHGHFSAVQHGDLHARVLSAERALAPLRAVDVLRRHDDAVVRHLDHHFRGSTERRMSPTVAACICTCIWNQHMQLPNAGRFIHSASPDRASGAPPVIHGSSSGRSDQRAAECKR
jgi:hypothetical protein